MSLDSEQQMYRTALYDRHAAAGAKMVPFAGWEMPIQYASILEEHTAVREKAGLFDVSHMGEVILSGPDRERVADRITTARIEGTEKGEVQYALLMNEQGGIVDDILVYNLPEAVLLVVNGANWKKDLDWIRRQAGNDAEVRDDSLATSQVALQGPRSTEILGKVADRSLFRLPYYRAARGKVAGVDALVSRTGYTGERGYEVYVKWDDGPAVWDALLEAGRDAGIRPIGLGARDSLRMEMRYCLYGNDISDTTSPLDAGLRWVVRAKEGDWIGRRAWEAALAAGPKRKLLAFRLGPRDLPRHGYPILREGKTVGTVTSGGFSPTLKTGIALGYVDAAAAKAKDGFTIEIRNREAEAIPVKGSFVPSSVKDDEEEGQ
ncbi:MAG: glycine cleavage system aminomethyltransferase GcvT [Candidatus Eisenbacteria bacterium]|nr:glycine cleavage system aminomethyltransferase GcvT [Candidatus Eisenbacteria bacterium]